MKSMLMALCAKNSKGECCPASRRRNSLVSINNSCSFIHPLLATLLPHQDQDQDQHTSTFSLATAITSRFNIHSQ